MILKDLLCLLAIIKVVVAQSTEECRTPRNQNGSCIPSVSCTSLNEIIQKRQPSKEEVNLLRQSRCGNRREKKVCCPNNGQLTEEESNSSATSKSISTTTEPRISVRKCTEYKEFAYDKVYVASLFGAPTEKKILNCPYRSTQLIVGGEEVIRGEFPHMALIGFENLNEIVWRCGGTLISERFVLSAAHCSDPEIIGPAKYVRLGEHDLNRNDDGTPINFNIIERIRHPKYQKFYHDIALFKLDKNVQFNYAVRPACLPEQSIVPTKTAIATGWGSVEFRGPTSDVLLKVQLDIFLQDECLNSTVSRKLKDGVVEDVQMCAGSHTERRDACQGDSGGPLQIFHDAHNCTYIVIGVTSLGAGCGDIGSPGVFTRVYGYLKWIEDTVWPNE